MKSLPLVLFCAMLISGCHTARQSYYSYQLGGYIKGIVKSRITHSSLISYGDYLFEFKLRSNIKESIIAGETKSSLEIAYDTIGLYLFTKNSDTYFEFDTFALTGKLIKHGNVSEKESGVSFRAKDPDLYGSAKSYQGIPTDTAINNISFKYVSVNLSNQSSTTDYKQWLFLIDNKSLNSLYRIRGENYFDPRYTIIGMHIYNLKANESFIEEPSEFRRLTRRQIDICKEIVRKAKLYVAHSGNDLP